MVVNRADQTRQTRERETLNSETEERKRKKRCTTRLQVYTTHTSKRDSISQETALKLFQRFLICFSFPPANFSAPDEQEKLMVLARFAWEMTRSRC